LGPVAAQYITAANAPLRSEGVLAVGVYSPVAHAKDDLETATPAQMRLVSVQPALNTNPVARPSQLSPRNTSDRLTPAISPKV